MIQVTDDQIQRVDLGKFKLAGSFGHGFGYGLFLLVFDRLGRIILGLGKERLSNEE